MGPTGIQRLLKELQASQLRSTRSADRKPFVRPVRVESGREGSDRRQACDTFSRDLSGQGIALISPVAWQERTIATLHVHSLAGLPVVVTAEVRWCEPYGTGWYLIGLVFLHEGPA